jgi:hypothetical protein
LTQLNTLAILNPLAITLFPTKQRTKRKQPTTTTNREGIARTNQQPTAQPQKPQPQRKRTNRNPMQKRGTQCKKTETPKNKRIARSGVDL